MAKILIVDDEIGIRELLSEILLDEGHDVALAENANAARLARMNARPDLVLLDIWMPDTDGITLLKEWAAAGQLTMPVVMMSGHGTIDTAVEATRVGAIDYLEKPISLQKLLSTVKSGLQRQIHAHAPVQPLTLAAFPRSAPLRDLRKRLEQLRAGSRHILLKVSTSSLAELAARSLQQPGRPWLEVTAGDAPLDARQLQANAGGLIYVPDLPHLGRAQQKTLAFVLDQLERHDLTLLALTDQPLETLQRDGWDDKLLARLFEVSLAPPALQEIRDDIPEIANQLLIHLVEAGEVPMRRFSTGALNALRTQAWSGGYSELRGAVKSLALGTLEDEISGEDAQRLAGKCTQIAFPLPLDLPLREARESFERMYFEHHLRQEGSNMTRLAERTGLERTHLYRKLKQLGISTGRRQEEA